MIRSLKKMVSDKGAGYRVNVRYQGQDKWYPCEVLDVDDVGILALADGEKIAIPWSGIAALSFAEVRR